MWVARVLKRPVDKNNASALSGAEFKKLAQETDSYPWLAQNKPPDE
jgi:hypothetical protein